MRSIKPETGRISDAFSTWLDLFRWLAALAVVMTHAENRLLTFVGDVPPPDREYMHYAYAFLAGFAQPAVMIFFVISGFLVGGGLWEEVRSNGTINLLPYLIKRTVRLWTVVIPALLLILLLDALSIFLFDGLRNNIFGTEIFSKLGAGSFLCNAAFFQTALCTEYGADGALWSLYNEFWYYLIWPPMLLALVSTLSLRRRLCCIFLTIFALFTLTYIQFSGAWLAPYMCIWLLGVLAAALNRPIMKRPFAAGLIFVGLVLAVRLSIRRDFAEAHQIYNFIIDLATAAAFSNFLLSLKCKSDLTAPAGTSLHSKLAGFSFSLYCIHTPILMLYASILMKYFGIGWRMKPNGPMTWLAVLGAITVCVALAYGFSIVTEANTGAIRRWIFDRIYLRKGPPNFHFVR